MALISIIGKPNSGKSTLFNALIGRRQAVVHNMPNLTRDRHYGDFEWRERDFTVIDTGGIEEGSDAPFIKLVEQQADIAINESSWYAVDFDTLPGLENVTLVSGPAKLTFDGGGNARIAEVDYVLAAGSWTRTLRVSGISGRVFIP